MKNNEYEKQKKSSELHNWCISKEQLAHAWIDYTKKQKERVFKQGEIIKCEFGRNLGYEIAKERPALIISADRYSSTGQLVVIPLTKNNSKRMATHYTLMKHKYTFLDFDSCVKTEQIRSISSVRVNQKIGEIDEQDIARIKIRVKTLFDM